MLKVVSSDVTSTKSVFSNLLGFLKGNNINCQFAVLDEIKPEDKVVFVIPAPTVRVECFCNKDLLEKLNDLTTNVFLVSWYVSNIDLGRVSTRFSQVSPFNERTIHWLFQKFDDDFLECDTNKKTIEALSKYV